ncbi:MAG: aldehyde dehydrogenase family protein [Deltaproteobacteria bacterium]|nr:aldehyde dehydrogenase family protein [Deltaproteobacteria bacterium]
MNTGSYIDGKWFHPKSNRLVRNLNPADPDEVIAEFPAATADDVNHAIDTAQAAFRSWKKTPGPERGRVLWRAADIARQRADEIARTLTREEGKVLKEAKGEVMKGISLLEYYAGEGYRMHGKTLPSEARDTFTYTIRRPLGVVGLIAPWNFPWAIPVWKSAPALAAGNCVIFKPAELTPATSTLLTEIYEQAGLPPGVFNMLVGSGSVVGEAIVHSPVLRAISFTGSNEVGGALYAKAAQRGAKVTCEMGGKNAVIVMADADLDKAAVAIHGGAFGSTGQRCTATSRAIVVQAVWMGDLPETLEPPSFGQGNDRDRQEKSGPRGSAALLGGKKPEHLGKGYFVEPTIFDGVTPAMRIFREEIFGPVLSVSTASNLEEALAFANGVEYGLTTSIFTENIDMIMNFVEEVETGMVHVNEPTIGGEAQLPFGGSKATGVGEREMAEEGLNFFTELKTVFINYSGKAERLMIR